MLNERIERIYKEYNNNNVYTEKVNIKTLLEEVKRVSETYNNKIYYTDLKLHKLASQVNNINDFNQFCEEEYNYFIDILDYNQLKCNHINRTSTFVVDTSYNTITQYFVNMYNEVIINEVTIINYLLEYHSYISLDEVIEDAEENSLLDILINELERDFKIIIEVYDYIEYFKRNQIELFEDAYINI